jgi:hypothetical protein
MSVCLLFFFIIFFWYSRKNPKDQVLLVSNNLANTKTKVKNFQDNIENINKNDEIITPSTMMSYDYYDIDNNKIQTTNELAPYFMIGMNKDQLKNYFDDWEVKKFSHEKVIMQKNINDSNKNQNYLISTKDGHVAVFYLDKDNIDNMSNLILKEITPTPIDSLTLEDRERLYRGIKIFGDETLSKIIQDYES